MYVSFISSVNATYENEVDQHGSLKAILIVVLFVVTFCLSLVPFFIRSIALHRGGLSSKIFSMLSVFGGGIFLATCILDLLPDSISTLSKGLSDSKYEIDFPIVELFVAIGFLFVLSVEQLIIIIRENGWISSGVEHLLHDQYSGIVHADYRSIPESSVEDVHFNPSSHSVVRDALLVLALSLHAAFEGLSVGMLSDKMQILQVFIALVLHKAIIGFSLGVRLVQSNMKNLTKVIYLFVFAFQVVLGGSFGITFLNFVGGGSPLQSAIISACAQALACGTFLYVTCFEILPHELDQEGLRPLKLIFIILGFTLIAFIVWLFP